MPVGSGGMLLPNRLVSLETGIFYYRKCETGSVKLMNSQAFKARCWTLWKTCLRTVTDFKQLKNLFYLHIK